MIEAVLDASVVLKWFRHEEIYAERARALRVNFEAGELAVVASQILYLEILNVAGRRWKMRSEGLIELAAALNVLGFERREPDLIDVARWTARGLTAYDATYVALAETHDVKLVTADELVLGTAPSVAVALWNVG